MLPFQNMSGDPEQEYFADGMVEDIITALSRFKCAVRHRPQLELHLQGPAVDIKQVGRELGVRYVLEGSVRKAATRAHHGTADRGRDRRPSVGRPFDGALDDIFDLQDQVTESVVGAIEPTLDTRRSSARTQAHREP